MTTDNVHSLKLRCADSRCWHHEIYKWLGYLVIVCLVGAYLCICKRIFRDGAWVVKEAEDGRRRRSRPLRQPRSTASICCCCCCNFGGITSRRSVSARGEKWTVLGAEIASMHEEPPRQTDRQCIQTDGLHIFMSPLVGLQLLQRKIVSVLCNANVMMIIWRFVLIKSLVDCCGGCGEGG